MQPQILVVSDPPHREVDHETAAAILGLALADSRLKIDFQAPEVLMAPEAERTNEVADSLRGAGLNVAVIDGRDLARVPWPAPVSSFDVGVEGLTARFQKEEVVLRYDLPIVGVYCKPPPDFPAGGPAGDIPQLLPDSPGGDGLAIAEAIEWMAKLDLYFIRGAALRRISIVQDVADFSGLGEMQGSTSGENMGATVAECARRFTGIELDTRLENVRPRQRFRLGDAGFDLDQRKRFSFGTLLLRQVLDSISPELRDLTQYEFGSRLAYVLSRHASERRM